MSRDQIDEMAWLIDEAYDNAEMTGSELHGYEVATHIYNAGYHKQEWISADERLPNPYISVLVYMPGEAPHPTVREGFLTKHGAWYAGGFDRLPDEVVMWKEMPEAPKMKGEKNG